MPGSRIGTRWPAAVALLAAGVAATAEEPGDAFFRGINLNGPPVVIDGRAWEGGDTEHLESRDQAFENQAVPLIPATDPDRARMIRSSRWNGQAELRLTGVPAGVYSIFLYVWEDNNSETFSVAIDGREVVHDHVSGPTGTWNRLGPWRVEVGSGPIRLTTRGGAANLSGVEIWKGEGPFPAPGEPIRPARPRDPTFDAEVAPILAKHCLECHGRSMQKGDLSLATEDRALDGGLSGPAVEPGDPDESLLWMYVEDDEMPRDRPSLSDGREGAAQAVDRRRREVGDGRDRPVPGDDRAAGRLRLVVAPAGPVAGAAGRAGRGLDSQRRRPLRAGEARGGRPAPRPRGRSPDADPPALVRPDRPAAVAGGGRAVPGRQGRSRL